MTSEPYSVSTRYLFADIIELALRLTNGSLGLAIKNLPEQNRKFLIIYYGLESGTVTNLAEVEKEMGIGNETARKLWEESLRLIGKEVLKSRTMTEAVEEMKTEEYKPFGRLGRMWQETKEAKLQTQVSVENQ